MTNRDVLEHQTNKPLCMSCHTTINPTGASFENFDQLGRLRTVEPNFDVSGTLIRNVSIDTQAAIPLDTGGTLGAYDSLDLIDYLASAKPSQACFSEKIYNYINQRQSVREDGCRINQIFDAVSDSSTPIFDVIVETVKISATRKRIVQ